MENSQLKADPSIRNKQLFHYRLYAFCNGVTSDVILYSASMSKKVRRALLIVAVIVMLMSAVLLAYTLAPRPAPVIERTAIVPVAPVAP